MENNLFLKAPGNWINDPNGFIYYKGQYHLFYQHFPFAPVWGTMHWGHAISPDLVHWTHKDIALFPTKEYDRNGIFSGSAIEVDGKMRLYYTGVKYLEENEENITLPTEKGSYQCQVMLESNGEEFDNYNAKRLVVPVINDENLGDPYDCRDPKVWKEDDTYYMCLGTTHKKECGALLILESKDGISWEINSRIEDKSLGYILECPDLFKINDQYVFISSPMGVMKGGKEYENQTKIRFAQFDGKNKKISLDENDHFLDYGMDIYAPQSTLDEHGNRVVISWLRMPCAVSGNNTAANGKKWNGQMSLPRVVAVENNMILTRPHKSVREYFKACVPEDVDESSKCAGYTIRQKEGNRQIFAALREGEALNLDGYKITLSGGCVCTDRSGALPEGVDIQTRCQSPDVGSACNLEIYMDNNIIEIYINDGRYVITNFISL